MNRIRLAAVSVGITLFDHAPLLINGLRITRVNIQREREKDGVLRFTLL